MEHLKRGIKPIMFCAGTPRQYSENRGGEEKIVDAANTGSKNFEYVDYYGDPDELRSLKFKNAGEYSYVISTIDELDKGSGQYKNCTGVIVAGKDKNTGKDISFLSHQDPHYFLKTDHNNSNNFFNDLTQRLNQMKERCIDGTIDAAIIGGNYLNEDEGDEDEGWKRTDYKGDYLKSIKLLSTKISQVLDFNPVIMTGPKGEKGLGMDNVIYNNKERRLYVVRPMVGDGTTESYSPTDLEKMEKKWQEAA